MRLISIVILSLSFSACSLKKSAVTVMGAVAWDGQNVLESQPDVELARDSLPALILSLDALRQSHPHQRHFAALLTKAYGQYAFGFFEEAMLTSDSKSEAYAKNFSRADYFYRMGRDIGLGAMKNKSLKSFSKKDAPLLFWTSFCWASWINLHRDDPHAIVDLPKVSAMLDRVAVLTPDYAFGSVKSFQGVLLASRPQILGGNPSKARAFFEEAIKIEPRYLMTKVLYAQYYAVQVQDRELFERLLMEVSQADKNLFPAQQLANNLAKRRAQILLAQTKRWF